MINVMLAVISLYNVTASVRGIFEGRPDIIISQW